MKRTWKIGEHFSNIFALKSQKDPSYSILTSFKPSSEAILTSKE